MYKNYKGDRSLLQQADIFLTKVPLPQGNWNNACKWVLISAAVQHTNAVNKIRSTVYHQGIPSQFWRVSTSKLQVLFLVTCVAHTYMYITELACLCRPSTWLGNQLKNSKRARLSLTCWNLFWPLETTWTSALAKELRMDTSSLFYQRWSLKCVIL